MSSLGDKLEYDFREEEEEIRRMLKSKLGYGFKDEELPPSLRAKISNLVQELCILKTKRSEYDRLMNDHDLEKQEEYEKQCLDAEYSKKIEMLEAEMQKLKIPSLFTLSKYIILGMIGVPLYAVILLPLTIIVAVALVLSYGFEALLAGLKILFLLIIPAAATIAWLILRLNRIKERDRIRMEIYGLRKQWDHDLNSLKIKYNELRRRSSTLLKSKEEELCSLEKGFETNLSQIASEIDSVLNIVFQAKMDFGVLQSALKNRGLVIEKLICPNCKEYVKLPENGHVVKCSYCGKDIYAVDTFRELESITSSFKNLTVKKDDLFH
jgi:hypothetical protein